MDAGIRPPKERRKFLKNQYKKNTAKEKDSRRMDRRIIFPPKPIISDLYSCCVLIHLTDTYPVDGKVFPSARFNPFLQRHELHATLNGAVRPVNPEQTSWDSRNIAIIMPLTRNILARTYSLQPSDVQIAIQDGLELPEGTLILVRKSFAIEQGIIDIKGNLLINAGKATVKITDIDISQSIGDEAEKEASEMGYTIKRVKDHGWEESFEWRNYGTDEYEILKTLAAKVGIPLTSHAGSSDYAIFNSFILFMKANIALALMHIAFINAEKLNLKKIENFEEEPTDPTKKMELVREILRKVLFQTDILPDELFADILWTYCSPPSYISPRRDGYLLCLMWKCLHMGIEPPEFQFDSDDERKIVERLISQVRKASREELAAHVMGMARGKTGQLIEKREIQNHLIDEVSFFAINFNKYYEQLRFNSEDMKGCYLEYSQKLIDELGKNVRDKEKWNLYESILALKSEHAQRVYQGLVERQLSEIESILRQTYDRLHGYVLRQYGYLRD